MKFNDKNYWKTLINMSLSRFFILRTLHKGATHGYALFDNLREFTQGCCTPSYGTIYPILKELEDGKFANIKVVNEGGRERKVYELTAKGELAYQQAIEAWQDILPFIEKAMHEFEDKK